MKNFTPYIRKINYYETDKMGIVHHSNYIRYFEEARLHWLEEAGYPYEKMEENNVIIPVSRFQCTNHMAVRYGETVSITVDCCGFNGFRFYCLLNVYNEKNELCASGKTEHFFATSDLKPLRLKNTHPDIYTVFKENSIIEEKK